MDLLDKMATFVRVVEAGSFSAAGRQLRVSSAAVSRQMALLEAELRVSLLLRTTRRMAVTSAGQRYYERCLRILREVEEARTIVKGDTVDGLLQISAPVTFGLARVVPQLRVLMERHPGLVVDLRLEDRFVDLALEGVDVAIRVGATVPDSVEIVSHPLWSFRRVLVAAPSYLKRRGEPKTPGALAQHEVLVAGSDTWALWSEGKEARVRVNARYRSNALHSHLELAAEGVGMAFLPEWFVAEDVRRRRLKRVLSGWSSESVTVHALHRTVHRGAPRVRALVEHLRASLA